MTIIPIERPPFTGVYSVQDAALYFRATTPPTDVPLKLWSRRRQHFTKPSTRHLYAWIRRGISWGELAHADKEALVLNFEDLIRLRLIVILRSRGLSYAAIKAAENEARDLTGSSQPFVTEPLWTAGSSVFMSLSNLLIRLSPGKQLALEFLREFLSPVNHGLSFERGIVDVWHPAPGILIDPEIQFGSPCIEGTRIETEVIWSFYQSGTTPEELARLYEVSKDVVRQAIAWESSISEAA